ncbi:MAG: iron complex outermembrane receptor protein [Zhongshania sp.]|jgi:iron complex outermembrane receptor protein
MKKSLTVITLLVCSSLTTAQNSLPPQSPGSVQPAKSKSSSRLIEEVLVTAQKREENSQDIPIMLSVFSGEKLDAMGIESTADLQKAIPGLTITYSYGYTVIYLRGVGTDAFLPNVDPSIATYIDGINIGPSHGKEDTLGPVRRVEVLKGPQGTLFGRNATGGAISIITEDPPEEFEGYIQLEKGNYRAKARQLYFGMPVSNSLGFTVALFDNSQDIYGSNEIFGGPGPEENGFSEGARVKMRWDPTDTFSATLIGTYSNQLSSSSLSQENTRPAPVLLAGVEADELDREWHNNDLGGTSTLNELYGGVFNWQPGPVDIKFIYSENYAVVDEAKFDLDSTEEDIAYFYTADQFNTQKTYEFQILSNEDTLFSEKLQWVAGFYRLEGEGGFRSIYLELNPTGVVASILGLPDLLAPILGPLVSNAPSIVLGNGGILETEADSIYTQATWSATENFNVTMGLRYQEETRGIYNSYLDVVSPTAGRPPNDYYKSGDQSQNIRIFNFSAPDIEEKTLSPRIALQYFIADSFQIFSSAQRGYKSPTYNIANFLADPDAVEREEVTAFEIGFKSDILDGDLRLNGALFKTKIDGLLTAIIAIPSGGILSFRNAGTAEIEGAEVDFQWRPMASLNPSLVISGGATYLDAFYTEYINGSGFDDDTGLYFGDDSLVPGSPARDFSGNRIVRTPRFSSNLSANQVINIGDFGRLEVGIDYYYNGGYNTTPQASPFYVQDHYETWAARVAYFYDPAGLQVTAFVNNAKDKTYAQSITQQDFGRTVSLAPPRTFGVRVKWNFGAFL